MRYLGRRKRQKRYCIVTSRGTCSIAQRLLYVFVISLWRPLKGCPSLHAARESGGALNPGAFG
ncbi:hypothetical protein BCh11DRAFT_05707 [Burkholderia sp. Ch1-1]|nr:hypothetical protein BCh11DRAFT_05707 [Burkholderia sp. Ch1-1]